MKPAKMQIDCTLRSSAFFASLRLFPPDCAIRIHLGDERKNIVLQAKGNVLAQFRNRQQPPLQQQQLLPQLRRTTPPVRPSASISTASTA